VKSITKNIEKLASKEPGSKGTGGMISKIKAAKDATCHGIQVFIANGREKKVIERIVSGEEVGTHFLPNK
jgi:glutamate 5-kinase